MQSIRLSLPTLARAEGLESNRRGMRNLMS
jgi:hypothetical protein